MIGLSFFVGLVTGIVISIGGAFLILKRETKRLLKEIDESKDGLESFLNEQGFDLGDQSQEFVKELEQALKDIETMGSVKARFQQVDEMIKEQLDLISIVDGPSKGAAHSKYKGTIAKRIRELEERKLEIYKTILADGVDPTLVAIVDGEKTKMKLSEAVSEMEGILNEDDNKKPYNKPKKPETDSKDKEYGHLKLIVNDEDNEDE